MPDTPSTTFDRLAALRLAQERALEQAHIAQEQHDHALAQTAYADGHAGSDYLRTAVAEARQRAQLHSAHSSEAGRLAEMWARVSTALAVSPDSGPATYDLTVQLDPKDVGKELARHVQTLRSPGTA
ncbi:hypothetical protein [Streptomyces chartreusis]|uniref:hypothetical protein n=1 Tax=Streptomyces chartreusis TaxID=1969 RepID=UPI0033BFBB1A